MAERLKEILKSEYGISNSKELDEAIRNQEFIDISFFCVSQEDKKN